MKKWEEAKVRLKTVRNQRRGVMCQRRDSLRDDVQEVAAEERLGERRRSTQREHQLCEEQAANRKATWSRNGASRQSGDEQEGRRVSMCGGCTYVLLRRRSEVRWRASRRRGLWVRSAGSSTDVSSTGLLSHWRVPSLEAPAVIRTRWCFFPTSRLPFPTST